MNSSDNVYAFPNSLARPAASVTTRIPLWELPSGCLCPVIGSCLGAEQLRLTLDRLFEARSELSDFELHVGVVRECGTRNRLSEHLQEELDRLYADDVRALTDVDMEAGLAEAWIDAAGRGVVAGAIWAILTHPRCGLDLAERLIRDLHMIQHTAIGAIGTQLDRAEHLAAENARLHAALTAMARECDQLRSAQMAPKAALSRWRRFLAGSGLGDRPYATSR